MDRYVSNAKALIKRGNATKEELEIALKNIVDNYSTRPRIVIYLDDYEHSREDIIKAVAEVSHCSCGYDPDFYTTCMEDRKLFEELEEELHDCQTEYYETEDELDKDYIIDKMREIVRKMDNKFDVDYSYLIDELD